MAIHGNKSQSARTKALAQFKDGSLPVLVATDIAAVLTRAVHRRNRSIHARHRAAHRCRS
jgi:superfamily II DNA/RNA helicase